MNGVRWTTIGLVVLGISQAAHAVPAGVGALVWSDEFSGPTIDANKWAVNAPGVWGDAVNTAAAASISDGAMKISTYTTGGTNYNAVMSTRNLAMFTYGYFEAKVQFNSSPGMWSAFWMMSPTMGTPLHDPATAGTEIDIAEHRGTNDVGTNYTGKFNSAIHWDGYGANAQSVQHLSTPASGLTNGTWHIYGMKWTPTSYEFYFDDQLMWTQTTNISQRSQYLELSSEAEDNSWAGDIPQNGYGSAANSTTNMLADYVHVYAVPEPAGLMTTLGSAGFVFMHGHAWVARRRRSRTADHSA